MIIGEGSVFSGDKTITGSLVIGGSLTIGGNLTMAPTKALVTPSNGTVFTILSGTSQMHLETTLLSKAVSGTRAITWRPVGGATGPGLTFLGTETNGTVSLEPTGTGDIKWGRALVALGAGAAPTVGTIGGSGPATAAQDSWLRILDSTGVACWVPAWK